jgi:hypothetical protein
LFVIQVSPTKIICPFAPGISHWLVVGELAHLQKLKPGAWRLKRKSNHEESDYINKRKGRVRPIRVGFGGFPAAGDGSFSFGGGGSPAIVTALWTQL